MLYFKTIEETKPRTFEMEFSPFVQNTEGMQILAEINGKLLELTAIV